MIFLTVGTHEPFDRLVRAVDDWCHARHFGDRVFGQITERARYQPSSFEWKATLDPVDYHSRSRDAELIISHAGMGSIITALSLATPIVIVPRRGHLGETRNDHQVATAERFGIRPGIHMAAEVEELSTLLDGVMSESGLATGSPIAAFAEGELTTAIRDFIFRGDRE